MWCLLLGPKEIEYNFVSGSGLNFDFILDLKVDKVRQLRRAGSRTFHWRRVAGM